MDSAERRLDHVDGLRGLAALFVVLHHAWLTAWPFEYGRAPRGWWRLTNVLAYGHFAVGVFIVVSGFCLMRPVVLSGRLPRGFLSRRARRILPPYYAALAFSLLLIWTVLGRDTGTHWDLSVPVSASGYVGNALLLEDVLGAPQVNHVFWSIAVECQIYLLFPLLVFVWRRRGRLAALALATAASAALCALVDVFPLAGPFRLAGLTPQYLFLFALGAAAAEVCFGSWRPRIPWAVASGLTACVLVCACVVLQPGAADPRLRFLDPLVGIATAALLVATTRAGRSRARTLLGSRAPATLGTFAYSVYLIHAPLLQLVWQSLIGPVALPAGIAFAALVLVGVPVAVACAYGFFCVCERPFVRRRYPSTTSGSSSRIVPSATSASLSASSSGG